MRKIRPKLGHQQELKTMVPEVDQVMMAKTIYNNEKNWDTNWDIKHWDTNWDINHLLINSSLLPFQDKNGTIELDEFLNMMATRLIRDDTCRMIDF